MSKIPTVEEILAKHTTTNPKENWGRNGKYALTNYNAAMKECAELVRAATLEEVVNKQIFCFCGKDTLTKQSILDLVTHPNLEIK